MKVKGTKNLAETKLPIRKFCRQKHAILQTMLRNVSIIQRTENM